MRYKKQGELVYRYRTWKGISQIKLAHKLGYKKGQGQIVNTWEKGRNKVPFEKMRELCLALDMSPEILKRAILKDKSKELEGYLYGLDRDERRLETETRTEQSTTIQTQSYDYGSSN